MTASASSAPQPGYRGRFAPSPTGPLHFGSLIAAVGGYLEARARGGEWLLRVEDLDPPRVVPGAVSDILHALEACGMHWNGAIVYQSAREDAYHAALHELKQTGRLYPCACSRREIADSAVSGIEGHVYPGACRAGLPPGKTARALRLDTRGARIDFTDGLQGHIEQDVETDIGDFVIYRADGIFAYQLAVVIDDAEQGVTDIVRGADLLDSTPRQIFLQRLLGLPSLRYLHLPVALDRRGEKLSKQTRARPIDPDHPAPALIAALRFLGQNPPPGLTASSPGEIWQWATANWRIEHMPRSRHAPSPL